MGRTSLRFIQSDVLCLAEFHDALDTIDDLGLPRSSIWATAPVWNHASLSIALAGRFLVCKKATSAWEFSRNHDIQHDFVVPTEDIVVLEAQLESRKPC